MTSLSLFVFIFSQTQTNQQHKIISNKRKNHHTSLSRLTRGVKKKNCLKMMQRKANPTMRSTAALINSANAKRCIETSFFFHSYFFNSSFFFAFLGNSEGSRYGCLSVCSFFSTHLSTHLIMQHLRFVQRVSSSSSSSSSSCRASCSYPSSMMRVTSSSPSSSSSSSSQTSLFSGNLLRRRHHVRFAARNTERNITTLVSSLTSSLSSSRRKNRRRSHLLFTTRAAAPDASGSGSYDEGVKKDWTESIQWLPFMNVSKATETEPIVTKENEVVLPIFPLGSNVHLPYSEHVLNIFEPRYRAMYNDILFNGSRRFVVPMCDPQAQGHFSKYACVFYLDDLKEVSEQTNDQVKYVCSHTCVSVVRIERVVNDTVWGDRSSYLKGVCVEIGDYGKGGEEGADNSGASDDGEYTTKESMLVEKFTRIIQMQQELDEPVRFREELVKELSAKNKKGGFWRIVELWQSLLTNRVNYKETELQQDVQALLQSFMKSQGPEFAEKQSRGEITLNSLPENIQNQFKQLQINYQEEARELVNEAIYPFQQLLEQEEHVQRLDFFSDMLANEENRLQTKLSLKNLFSSSPSSSSSDSPDEEDDPTTGQDN